ncbi:MAG: GNAT family N-acetyltransferase [Halieaceae bacterium]|jgi:putative acetyltransferase|nr:GNAT family N-acetyltransferase [Halieaceae bacterium]
MAQLVVRIDDLRDGMVEQLLHEHRREMHLYSPPESIHALESGQLKDSLVTFWGVWMGQELAGCGALKALSPDHGEVKSMRTARAHLRKGVGAEILRHILQEALVRSYTRVSLETGTNDTFLLARALYERFGFRECGPFGDYDHDPYSTFYAMELA